VDAAENEGPLRLVKVSAFAASLEPPPGYGRIHAAVEQRLARSTLRWTVLQPYMYMQNFLDMATPIRRAGRLPLPLGHSPVAYVAGTEEEIKRLPEKPAASPKIAQGWPNYGDLYYGRVKGRENDRQITFYHNFGNQGLAFSSVGGYLYRKVKSLGLGREFPTDWFLQDIRN